MTQGQTLRPVPATHLVHGKVRVVHLLRFRVVLVFIQPAKMLADGSKIVRLPPPHTASDQVETAYQSHQVSRAGSSKCGSSRNWITGLLEAYYEVFVGLLWGWGFRHPAPSSNLASARLRFAAARGSYFIINLERNMKAASRLRRTASLYEMLRLAPGCPCFVFCATLVPEAVLSISVLRSSG